MLRENKDQWEIDTSDASVIRCIVDHAFSIQIASDSCSLTLQIENEFGISHGAQVYHCEPENVDSLVPALYLRDKAVKKITAMKSGALNVEFENDYLQVKPGESFEAWQLYSDDGLRIICMPGGELAIWLPDN